MAISHERVHRLNNSGVYDTIHYETDSSVVLMKNGSTLEDTKTALLNADALINTRLNNIESQMTTPFNTKGALDNINDLDNISNPELNDTYYIRDLRYRMTWNGEDWIQSGMDGMDTLVPITLRERDMVYGSTTSGKLSVTSADAQTRPRVRTRVLHLKAGSSFSVAQGWVYYAVSLPDASETGDIQSNTGFRTDAYMISEDGYWSVILGQYQSGSTTEYEDLTDRIDDAIVAFTGRLYMAESVGTVVGDLTAPVTPERTDFFERGGNLFSGLTVVNDRYLNAGGAAVAGAGSQYAEEFIPIKKGAVYSWTGADGFLIATYHGFTGLERLLSPYAAARPGSIVFNEDVTHVRLSCYQHSFPEGFMFVKGEVPAEYEEARLVVRGENLPSVNDWNEDMSGQMFYSYNPEGGYALYTDQTAGAFFLYLPIGETQHIRIGYIRDIDLRTAEDDPEGVSYRDKDIWRLHRGVVGRIRRMAGQYVFEEGVELIRNGAWEAAVYYTPGGGTARAVATFHGFERLASAAFKIDGATIPLPTEKVPITKCESFTAETVSVIHRKNMDTVKLADAVRTVTVTAEGVTVRQTHTWAVSAETGELKAYLGMGCARRRTGDYDEEKDRDMGLQVTDFAACDGPVPVYPAFEWDNQHQRWNAGGTPIGVAVGGVYDVSRSYHHTPISGNSDNSGIEGVKQARLWGVETGLGVEMTVDFTNRFYVSCNPAFNKLYFRRGDTETVNVGDSWTTTTEFRFSGR